MLPQILIVLVVVASLVALAITVVNLRKRARRLNTAKASRMFHERREWLEAEFLTKGSQSGSPRGLVWNDCEFDDDVSFARDRRSGVMTALVAVAIKFEAIDGGGMEEVEAVANQKARNGRISVRRHEMVRDR